MISPGSMLVSAPQFTQRNDINDHTREEKPMKSRPSHPFSPSEVLAWLLSGLAIVTLLLTFIYHWSK